MDKLFIKLTADQAVDIFATHGVEFTALVNGEKVRLNISVDQLSRKQLATNGTMESLGGGKHVRSSRRVRRWA